MLRYGLLAGKPFEPASSCLPYAERTARLIESLQAWGVRGTAQSSWGPTVMAVCESPAAAEGLVARVAASTWAEHYDTLVACFAGEGAVVRETSLAQARATGRP